MDHVPSEHQHDADVGDGRGPLTRRAPVLPIAAAVLAATLFAALGMWQVERRAWKLDLIARVDARAHAAPGELPDWRHWTPAQAEATEYRRVRARGVFDHARETLVTALTARGAGYWVLTPLRTARGTVLVNRGFVPTDRRTAGTRTAGQVAGSVEVTGLVRRSEPGGGFLRANDPRADRWYSRDVAAIAGARGLRDAAPYFIDVDATPQPGGLPVGGLTILRFRNTHLLYALTWFALSAMSVGAGVLIWRRRGER